MVVIATYGYTTSHVTHGCRSPSVSTITGLLFGLLTVHIFCLPPNGSTIAFTRSTRLELNPKTLSWILDVILGLSACLLMAGSYSIVTASGSAGLEVAYGFIL